VTEILKSTFADGLLIWWYVYSTTPLLTKVSNIPKNGFKSVCSEDKSLVFLEKKNMHKKLRLLNITIFNEFFWILNGHGHLAPLLGGADGYPSFLYSYLNYYLLNIKLFIEFQVLLWMFIIYYLLSIIIYYLIKNKIVNIYIYIFFFEVCIYILNSKIININHIYIYIYICVCVSFMSTIKFVYIILY
jgi:hypothetical protein